MHGLRCRINLSSSLRSIWVVVMMMMMHVQAFSVLNNNVAFVSRQQQRSIGSPATTATTTTSPHYSSSSVCLASFAADGSEYSSKDTDFEDDENEYVNMADGMGGDDASMEDSTPTIELQPVPMSKNSGNRFVAIVWDQDVDIHDRDVMDLHYDRDKIIEDHVIYCRKRNLYNETFNADSMVDILFSFPILSSDLRRVVGHTLILESKDVDGVKECLQDEPILQSLSDGDLSNVQLYRWRHIRDYTLRIDDGRDGFPCMAIALDDDKTETNNDISQIRSTYEKENLEYWIRSERVIASGPIHLPTAYKNDPSSIAVGDFILFNAKNRDDAISFIEDMPYSQQGLYKDIRVHFYNSLDITGKFVTEDPLRDAPCKDLKEAMGMWGYPVEDEQTPWLNW